MLIVLEIVVGHMGGTDFSFWSLYVQTRIAGNLKLEALTIRLFFFRDILPVIVLIVESLPTAALRSIFLGTLGSYIGLLSFVDGHPGSGDLRFELHCMRLEILILFLQLLIFLFILLIQPLIFLPLRGLLSESLHQFQQLGSLSFREVIKDGTLF